MYSLSLNSGQSPPECAFLFRLPLAIRQHIYRLSMNTSSQKNLGHSPLSFVSRQIRSEFLAMHDFMANARFRCCLGRTNYDRETTRFYTYDYHITPWGSPIEISPASVSKLKECTIRCTIEELSSFEQHSAVGADTFKDCLRIITTTFKECQKMRDLRIQFDHFALARKDGLLEPKGIFGRCKRLCELPGVTEISFVTSWETLKWKAEKVGKGNNRRTNWVMDDIEKLHTYVVGAKYNMRRGNT